MGIFDRFFKSDELPTRNKDIISAHKVLHDATLSNADRMAALAKLKTIFLSSGNKDDLKVICDSMLGPAKNDEYMEIRAGALKTFYAVVENCLFMHTNDHHPQHAGAQAKLNVIAECAMPALMEIAESRAEEMKDIRKTALAVVLKMTPFEMDDARLAFLGARLVNETGEMKAAVLIAFEALVKSSDATLKRRIARFCLPALCEILDDPALWARAARVIGGLESAALSAAPQLFAKLDAADGEWAAVALRSVSGQTFSKEEKPKWEKWLAGAVVKEEDIVLLERMRKIR